MSVSPTSSPRSSVDAPVQRLPNPNQPSPPSGWGLSSISSYLTWPPSDTSLFGRCIIWIQGVWQRFFNLFYKNRPTPPPIETPITAGSPPIVGSEKQTEETSLNTVSEMSVEDVVQKQVKGFKGEIFRGTLYITKRTAPYIGKDASYQFGKVLHPFMTEEILKVSPNDICISCEVENEKEVEGEDRYFSIDLPHSIFSQARVGNKIYYLYEGALFIYELGSHPGQPELSFDAALECCKVNTEQYCPGEFFEEQDVPDDYHCWDNRYQPGKIYLSPQTKYVRVGIPGAIPIDFIQLRPLHPEHNEPEFQSRILTAKAPDQLQDLAEYSNLRQSIAQNGNAYFHITQFVACGRPEIDILLDGRRLFVHIDYSSSAIRLQEHQIPLSVQPLSHSFFKRLLPYREEEFDPENIFASLNDTGILTLVIPLRPEAFSKGGTLCSSEAVSKIDETSDDFPKDGLPVEEWVQSELANK